MTEAKLAVELLYYMNAGLTELEPSLAEGRATVGTIVEVLLALLDGVSERCAKAACEDYLAKGTAAAAAAVFRRVHAGVAALPEDGKR
jgi:hypothetical protein